MVKVVESFDETSAHFMKRFNELINEIYNLDNSVNISGDLYVKELSEKLCRYLKNR